MNRFPEDGEDNLALDVPVTPLKIEPISQHHSQQLHHRQIPSVRHLSSAATPSAAEMGTESELGVTMTSPSAMIMANATGVALAQAPLPEVSIQNIVATCNLGTQVDLKHLAMHARNAEYNPKRFSAVIMRIREPRTTALVFNSGKMVITGAKSEDLCRLAARKYARIVQKLGFKVKFLDFKIQNVVGSADVRFAIQLEALFITHSQFAAYEPELFPGLIYRMVNPRVVLLIFVSGKIVITGAKCREYIESAFRQIYPVVKSFKK